MIIALAFSGLFVVFILFCLFYATTTIRAKSSEQGARKHDLKARLRGVRSYAAFVLAFIIAFVGYGVLLDLRT